MSILGFVHVQTHSAPLIHLGREISIQGEGALPLVQWPISFFISCFEKHEFNLIFFQQPSLELIDNCTSGNLGR